jgi:PAS domain S-box-containing protein
MAMLIDLMNGQIREPLPVHIFAHDQDEKALNLARRGFYPHLVTADLSSHCIDQFFEATEEGYRINERIRNLVRFCSGRIEDQEDIANLDLVVCRKPMMFRNESMQKVLLETFYNRLRPGGVLVVEPSVQSPHLSKYFETVDRANGVYGRRRTAGESSGSSSIRLGDILSKEPPASLSPQDRFARFLEHELYQMCERLQKTVSEYEGAHDELITLNQRLEVSLREVMMDRDQFGAEIDGLKHTEAALKQSNEDLSRRNERLEQAHDQLQNILAHSTSGLLYLNEALEIELFSPIAGRLFNLEDSDVGRPIMEVASPFEGYLATAIPQVLKTQTPAEFVERTDQGRWFRVSLNPMVQNGRQDGVVCTFVEITEQKRAGEWDRFKANVLNRMHDAVIVTNKERHVTYLNQAAKERYGVPKADETGGPLEDLYRNMWKDEQDKEAAHRELAAEGCWTGEHYHVTRDGREVKVYSSLNVLMDEADEEIGILTVVRNIESPPLDETSVLRLMIADIEKRTEALEFGEDSNP